MEVNLSAATGNVCHLDDEGASAHSLRHTFVTSCELHRPCDARRAGRARPTRDHQGIQLPADEDKTKALDLLITDQ